MVGKNPMKDWKSACVTWERERRNRKGHRLPEPKSEEESKYNNWLTKNYSKVATMEEPLTYEQFKALDTQFSREKIIKKLGYLQNWAYLQRNTSAYSTLQDLLIK